MKLLKKTRFSLVLMLVLSLFIVNVSVVSAIEPKIVLTPCDGSFNEYISKTTGNREVLRRTGIYLDPGDSMSVKYGVSETLSNTDTLNLIPELLSMGYSYSVSVSSSYSVTVRNPSSSMKEAIAYRIYDNIRYDKGAHQGNGSCSVSTSYARVYTGYLLSCQ